MNNKNGTLDLEYTLQILNEIESNPKITQRSLAQKLELSLGKINFLVNTLAEKSIIKVTNFKNSQHKLAYMYLFTPHGIRRKIELTHEFLILKVQEYEKLRREIEFLKEKISQYSKDNF